MILPLDILQFSHHTISHLVSHPRTGGPGLKSTQVYPAGFAKRILTLHKNLMDRLQMHFNHNKKGTLIQLVYIMIYIIYHMAPIITMHCSIVLWLLMELGISLSSIAWRAGFQRTRTSGSCQVCLVQTSRWKITTSLGPSWQAGLYTANSVLLASWGKAPRSLEKGIPESIAKSLTIEMMLEHPTIIN